MLQTEIAKVPLQKVIELWRLQFDYRKKIVNCVRYFGTGRIPLFTYWLFEFSLTFI